MFAREKKKEKNFLQILLIELRIDLPNKIKPILRNNINPLVRRSWQRLLKFRSTDLYAGRTDHCDYPRNNVTNKSLILKKKKKETRFR